MALSMEAIPRHPRTTNAGAAALQEKPALSEQAVLESNLFASCSGKELLALWDALRVFYANGFIQEDSPLEPYRQRYNAENQPGLGLLKMEQDLLRAMAVRFARSLRGENNS